MNTLPARSTTNGGGETGLTPRTFDEATRFAETVARSAFIPDVYRGKPGDVLACILAGHELGIGPMQALRAIHVVKGKPILSADLMVALVKRSPECDYFRLSESTPERVTYVTLRRGDPEPTPLTWTMEDARRAGLAGGDNWRKHPAAMLRARCASALARAVYPDLVLGIYEESEGEEIAGRVSSGDGARHVEDAEAVEVLPSPRVVTDAEGERAGAERALVAQGRTDVRPATEESPARALYRTHGKPLGLTPDAFKFLLDEAATTHGDDVALGIVRDELERRAAERAALLVDAKAALADEAPDSLFGPTTIGGGDTRHRDEG